MLGKIEETWSHPDYDAARFTHATAYMRTKKCDYSFHTGTHGLEAAKTLGRAWADEIGGEYKEHKAGDTVKIVVTDHHVTGRTQGHKNS